MSQQAAWKLAVIGGVGVVAGVVLLSAHWTIAELAALVGFVLVARGALHLVTASFVGLAGACAVLDVAGDVGVGITALAWPEPTLLSLVLVVGSWAILRSVVVGTIAATTRADDPCWPLSIVFATVEVVLGVVLVARPGGSVRGTAVTISLLVLIEGAREMLEAAFRQRREHRSRQAVHQRSAAVTS